MQRESFYFDSLQAAVDFKGRLNDVQYSAVGPIPQEDGTWVVNVTTYNLD